MTRTAWQRKGTRSDSLSCHSTLVSGVCSLTLGTRGCMEGSLPSPVPYALPRAPFMISSQLKLLRQHSAANRPFKMHNTRNCTARARLRRVHTRASATRGATRCGAARGWGTHELRVLGHATARQYAARGEYDEHDEPDRHMHVEHAFIVLERRGRGAALRNHHVSARQGSARPSIAHRRRCFASNGRDRKPARWQLRKRARKGAAGCGAWGSSGEQAKQQY